MVGRETDTAICRCDVATVQRFLWAIPFVRTTFSGIESVSSEGYRSGPSARLDCSRFFCRCCCWEEVQVLCSSQEWQETDLAISDHETHLYLDQLLYLIPVPDQLVPWCLQELSRGLLAQANVASPNLQQHLW